LQTLRSWRQKLNAIYNQILYFVKYLSALSKFLWRKTFPYLKKFHINAFPSSRLKDFNGLDVALKFSSEFVLLAMAGLIAFWNFNFLGHGKTYTDKSHAGRLVVSHPEINEKLYAKMSVINTVVLSQSLMVPAAQAEEAVSLTPDALYTQTDQDQNFFGNDTIQQLSPDSVQQLLAKQIKVYQTKENDTLKSIASTNGISVSTIMWANKLTSSSIKPGWFLVILPTDGILVHATNNDTLPDIAHKYNPEKYNSNAQIRENAANDLLEKIISYNGLEGAEDIQELIIVPGGVIATPPSQTPSPPSQALSHAE
jgi:LysM repeat protein